MVALISMLQKVAFHFLNSKRLLGIKQLLIFHLAFTLYWFSTLRSFSFVLWNSQWNSFLCVSCSFCISISFLPRKTKRTLKIALKKLNDKYRCVTKSSHTVYTVYLYVQTGIRSEAIVPVKDNEHEKGKNDFFMLSPNSTPTQFSQIVCIFSFRDVQKTHWRLPKILYKRNANVQN